MQESLSGKTSSSQCLTSQYQNSASNNEVEITIAWSFVWGFAKYEGTTRMLPKKSFIQE